jgi:anti-sigma regulatory factor (Ser/Thr protein kinase)
MKLALDEVLSNIVKYAYGKSGPGLIDVDLTYENNKLVATVQDSGIPFNPLRTQGQVSREPLISRKEGGLGIVFIKSLMDSVVYERNGDRNKVVLTLEVPPPRVDHPARG